LLEVLQVAEFAGATDAGMAGDDLLDEGGAERGMPTMKTGRAEALP
jgi:hypothetical protein